MHSALVAFWIYLTVKQLGPLVKCFDTDAKGRDYPNGYSHDLSPIEIPADSC